MPGAGPNDLLHPDVTGGFQNIRGGIIEQICHWTNKTYRAGNSSTFCIPSGPNQALASVGSLHHIYVRSFRCFPEGTHVYHFSIFARRH